MSKNLSVMTLDECKQFAQSHELETFLYEELKVFLGMEASIKLEDIVREYDPEGFVACEGTPPRVVLYGGKTRFPDIKAAHHAVDKGCKAIGWGLF